MKKLHHNVKDISGERFGRLVPRKYIKGSKWECKCDCGRVVIVSNGHLRTGDARSCGCLLRDVLVKRNTTHRHPRDKTYWAWSHMIQRCTNPNNKSWSNYGGRGITVCSRWMDFSNFFADMGDPGDRRLTIDRIDNDRGYEPGNCRWATRAQQSRNRRDRRLFTIGELTLPLWEWAKRSKLSHALVRGRIEKGWDIERATKTPKRVRSR